MPKRRATDFIRLATAPARFAIDQTRTNIRTAQRLHKNLREYREVLTAASAETAANVARILSAAEMSLPANIQAMPAAERQRAIEESLARGQAHLFAAAGELYCALRLAESSSSSVAPTKPGQMFDNPPQAAFPDRR